MSEPILDSQENNSEIGLRVKEIPSNKWHELLSEYPEDRAIVYPEMDGYSIHDYNKREVIVDRGATLCTIIVADKPAEDQFGRGHYAMGSDSGYEKFMNWIATSSDPKSRQVHIFGQAFSELNSQRGKLVKDLEEKAGLDKSQIIDHRPTDSYKNFTDNIIIDRQKGIIYLRRIETNITNR